MHLGLLGSDAAMIEVVAAALRRGDTVTAADAVAGGSLPAAVDVAGSWERMLDPQACDAVLVGSAGWNPGRAEAVRTLVQAGRPLVLAHPLELSMLWAYELEMIRRDTGAVLVPYLPDRLHPFMTRLREELEASLAGVGSRGVPEALVLERRMADRSREAVLFQFARDADLVRFIAGDPSRLATLAGADPVTAWGRLAVGLTGPAQLPVRWEVAPGDPGLLLRLHCAAGAVLVQAPGAAGTPWSWNGLAEETPPFDRAAAILGELDRRLRRGDTAATAAASWADAARAIELAETVPRSLAKGRAVDLHREEFTELGTFRGTMASLGCGIVLLGLVVVIVATLIAGVAHEFDWAAGRAVADAWPAIMLAVLGAFLALQLLPLLIGGGEDSGRRGS